MSSQNERIARKQVTNLPQKTGCGLEQNVARALCYVLGWLTGIIFLIIEKDNKFVRFHAARSITIFGAISIVQIILWVIPVIGWILGILLSVATFILWLLLIYKAYQGKMYKLPVTGDIVEKTANRPPNNLPGHCKTLSMNKITE